MIQKAFEISEEEKLPILLRITTRMAHSRAVVSVKDEAAPQNSLPCANDPASWVLLPANARRSYEKLTSKQNHLKDLSLQSPFNQLYIQANGKSDTGIIACGIGYNYVKEYDNNESSILKISISTSSIS